MMNTLQDVIHHRQNLQTCVCIFMCRKLGLDQTLQTDFSLHPDGSPGIHGAVGATVSWQRARLMWQVWGPAVSPVCHLSHTGLSYRLQLSGSFAHAVKNIWTCPHTCMNTWPWWCTQPHKKTTTVRSGPVQCAWSSAEGLVNDHYTFTIDLLLSSVKNQYDYYWLSCVLIQQSLRRTPPHVTIHTTCTLVITVDKGLAAKKTKQRSRAAREFISWRAWAQNTF